MSDFRKPVTGGGSGITQLTGDVTAGPGSGSQAATIGPMLHDLNLNQFKLLIDSAGGWIRGDGIGHILARSSSAAGGILEVHSEAGSIVLGCGPTLAPQFTMTAGGGFTMSAPLSMSSQKISSVADPTLAQDAATKNYIDTGFLPLSGGALTGALALGAHKVTGVADPTLAQDAATKNYVDTHGSGTPVVGSNSFTAQNANITSTLLFTAAATGLYSISAYMVVTTGDGAAGTVTLNLTWTDDFGAQPATGITSVALTTAGSNAPAAFPIEVVSGQTVHFNTTVDTTYGTSQYSLYISAVKVF